MKANANKSRIFHQWQVNPSIIWVPFCLPFLLYGEMFITAFLLIMASGVVLAKSCSANDAYSSWSNTLFLPIWLLLGSTYVTLLCYSTWHVIWSLFSISLSAGWLWCIEDRLSSEYPIALREWLRSARGYGLGSLILLVLYLLNPLPQFFSWSLPLLLLTLGVIIHQYQINHHRGNCHTFTCSLGTPLVRMAMIWGNELWLTKSPYTGCFVDAARTACHSVQPLDHPLTSCVGTKETPEDAIHRAYLSTHMYSWIQPHFLVKYVYKNRCERARTIYLYVLNIPIDMDKKDLPIRGEFFTTEEIEKRIKEGLFKPLFIEEYKYLKQTLLKANRISTESIDISF